MRFKHVFALLSLFFLVLPLSAQTWEVYDNFDGPLINPALWSGNNGASQVALEYLRQIQGGQLYLWMRSYGLTFTDEGQNWGLNSVGMVQPMLFKGIRARLTVIRAMGNSIGALNGQITLRATLFNFRTGDLPDPLDDIEANVHMYSNGEDNQPLEVGGSIISGRQDWGGVTLGSVNVGETVYIWVRWDKPNKKCFFGFQRLRKNQPPVEMEIPYGLDDNTPPMYPKKEVDLQASPKNSSSYLVYSDMMVKIDQVSVLQ